MKRRHCLYTVVHNTPCKLVIARLPSEFLAIDKWRRPLLQYMRRVYGIRTADIFEFQGIAGMPAGEEAHEEPLFLARLRMAFEGNPEPVPSFDLIAWNEDTQDFSLARPALTSR